MAEQSFSTMAKISRAGESMEDFKQYLTNAEQPWLLILDNADDPALDVTCFLPPGNRGTVIITTRNPDCRCHATVGKRELSEMETNEAITLLLRSSDREIHDPSLRDLAHSIVGLLRSLALAVVHAGAFIRQGICTLEDYSELYERHRSELLQERPSQTGDDYNHAVYTTWEISLHDIRERAKDTTDAAAINALDLLHLFGFFHFANIIEDIFLSARKYLPTCDGYPWWRSHQLGMIRRADWDPLLFRKARQLLSSYSLIRVDGLNDRISLHPLVHSWIRDSLDEAEHLHWWNRALGTLALAYDSRNPALQSHLIIHSRHCLEA